VSGQIRFFEGLEALGLAKTAAVFAYGCVLDVLQVVEFWIVGHRIVLLQLYITILSRKHQTGPQSTSSQDEGLALW
jgi:hypothetical protein